MKCSYIFLMLFLLSCGQGSTRAKNDQEVEKATKSNQVRPTEDLEENKWEEPAENQVREPKEISILNLYKAMEDKDEEEFLRQFPKDFNQFQNYFGWDTVNDAPNVLYEHGVHYIEYLFYLLRTNKYPSHEKKHHQYL